MPTVNSESPKRRFFARLVRNWVSLVGAILVVSSWFAFFLLLTLDFFAPNRNPYLGILTYLVAPLFFLVGVKGISRLARRSSYTQSVDAAMSLKRVFGLAAHEQFAEQKNDQVSHDVRDAERSTSAAARSAVRCRPCYEAPDSSDDPLSTSTILPVTPPFPSNSCACLASARGNRCAISGLIFCC